jgi:prolyl oligopeptidase
MSHSGRFEGDNGGAFGPEWHETGLKTHRQLIYDDFAAVARDLIAR